MNCVYCETPYTSNVGCCDKAAMSIALVALRYHTECEHSEVKDAIAQLCNRLAQVDEPKKKVVKSAIRPIRLGDWDDDVLMPPNNFGRFVE